jgi:uncharacterized protein (TIGR03437 family)
MLRLFTAALLAILPCMAQLPPGVLYSTTIPYSASGAAPPPTVSAVATDALGNTYITGSVSSNGLRSTSGVLQPGFAGGTDAFIAKLDSKGTLVFLTYLGGPGADTGNSIAVDSSGNIYVGGTATSPSFLLPGTTAPPGFQGTAAFIAELSGDGKRMLWSAIPGNSGQFALAPDGSMYVLSGTYTTTVLNPNSLSVGLAKYTANKQSVVGIILPAGASALSIGADGSVYVGGGTSGRDVTPTSGAWQTTLAASSGGFVAKVNGDLSGFAWLSFVSGNEPTGLKLLAASPDGSVWVSGFTPGTFPVLPGPFQWLAPYGAFLVRLSADGSKALVSTYFPAASTLAPDVAGNLVFSSTMNVFFGTPGSPWPCGQPGATANGFIGKLDANGQKILWGTQTGPSVPLGQIAVDQNGNMLIAATDASGDVTLSALTATLGERLVESCITQASPPYLPGPLAPGELFSIFAAGFGPAQGVVAQPSGGSIGTSLGGLQVFIEDTPSSLLYVSSTQINLVAPYLLNGRTAAHIKIVTSSGTSNQVVLGVREVLPEIFAVANQDGTQNSQAHPAHAGDFLSIWASGLGQTNPPGVDGAIPTAAGGAPLLPITLQLATVQGTDTAFGSPPGLVNAAVLYAGNAPGLVSGATQINFQMPALSPPLLSTPSVTGPPYAASVTMTVDGVSTSTEVWFE